MAEAREPRVADEQHQADAGDRQDEHLRELADVELAQHDRRQQQARDEEAVPEEIAAVPEEADVVEVGGLEEDAHAAIPS